MFMVVLGRQAAEGTVGQAGVMRCGSIYRQVVT